jgi:transcriptional regulator with XRE-family HTH domain
MGLTQEQLAERISSDDDYVRQSEVSRLESGHVGLPRRARLERIAAALELPLGELLARSGWAGAVESFHAPDEPTRVVKADTTALEPNLALTDAGRSAGGRPAEPQVFRRDHSESYLANVRGFESSRAAFEETRRAFEKRFPAYKEQHQDPDDCEASDIMIGERTADRSSPKGVANPP